MPLFKNPADEQTILNALKAYIEEWGEKNVRVIVPETWRPLGVSAVGVVPVMFSSRNAVAVIAGTRTSYVKCEVAVY